MARVKQALPNIIKVALVDDQHLFRAGIKSLLKDYSEFEVVFEAANGKELMEQLKNKQPHVILLDVEMPVMSGTEAAELIIQRYPLIKIIILTMHSESEFIFDMMIKGVHAFLPKDRSVEEVVDAMKTVMKNGVYYSAQITEAMVNGSKNQNKLAQYRISDLEIEIIKMICKEMTTKEIGEHLNMSPRTLEKHRAVIYEKIGAKNPIGVVVFALKNRLIRVEEIS